MSLKIRNYVSSVYGMEIIRCCVPNWKVEIYEEKMPAGILRDSWKALPHTAEFALGDAVWPLCANCSNIIEECHPDVAVHSLWKLIDADKNFPYPDASGLQVTIQDCWRSRKRKEVQDAVRSLLQKMHISYIEAKKHYQETDFCGVSLYKPQVARNPALAPKHDNEGAAGLFLPHTGEEQKQIMTSYCKQYQTDTLKRGEAVFVPGGNSGGKLRGTICFIEHHMSFSVPQAVEETPEIIGRA